MATTKTIQPTGTTITMPAMTDKPDISVFSTDIGRITDAVNALDSKATVSAIRYDGIDLNTLTTPGVYACNNCTNAPGTGWFNVEVLPIGAGGAGNESYAIQRATQIASNNIYERANAGGTWGSWEQLALKSMLTTVTATYSFSNVGAGAGTWGTVQLSVPSGKTLLMASVYQITGLNLVPVWIKSVGSSSVDVMVWNGRTSEANVGVTVVGLCW